MKIRLKESYRYGSLKDNASKGTIFEALEKIHPSRVGETSNDKEYYLIPTDDGHTNNSSIKSYWVNKIFFEIIEVDTICGLVKLGQRWCWNNEYNINIVEIMEIVAGNTYEDNFPFKIERKPSINFKVLQIIQGVNAFNEIFVKDYSFDSENWKYLIGQDKIQ